MDMLVRLYDLPDGHTAAEAAAQKGVEIRRAMAYEKAAVIGWVQGCFGHSARGWASECDIAFGRLPISCFVATSRRELTGFACYDSTLKGFLGPIGVAPSWQGAGIGKALLLAALQAMHMEGYGYAIIGNAGPTEFFHKAVGAVVIASSEPGIYVPPAR